MDYEKLSDDEFNKRDFSLLQTPTSRTINSFVDLQLGRKFSQVTMHKNVVQRLKSQARKYNKIFSVNVNTIT